MAGGCAWQNRGCAWRKRGHAWQGGVHGMHAPHPPGRILRDTVGKCTGGTHPTGMHSCFSNNLTSIKVKVRASVTRCGSINNFLPFARRSENSDIPFTMVVYEKIFGSINK